MTKIIEKLSSDLRKKLCSSAWRAVTLLGGQTKAAEILSSLGDDVSPQLLRNWLHREQYVPLKHVKFVVKALKGQMTSQEIRPDYF